MNITEKILARASGKDEVSQGEIVDAKVDVIMLHDLTGPIAVESFRKIEVQNVWDNQKIVIVLDHQVPANTIRVAKLHNLMRDFAREQKIQAIYDVGEGGICHQVLPEKGHVLPGTLIVGADSHTCTYGAFGAFATGIGSTEAAAVLATGKIWLRVPEAIKISVEGQFQKFVTPKDLILFMIGQLGSDGTVYKSVEFAGSAVSNMSVAGRMTLCNMAVEMGAKNGIIEPDEAIKEFFAEKTSKAKIDSPKWFRSDPSTPYGRVLNYAVTSLEPQVSCPSSVDNVKPISKVAGVQVDQAFIGSCTNGRLEDLRLAADILKGKKIDHNVRLLIIPASQEVYLQAIREGLVEVFAQAGGSVCNPTCGPCLGGHLGILAPHEVCISSSNRNFIGRMGSPDSEVYLASPATVAASAITGQITDPREWGTQNC